MKATQVITVCALVALVFTVTAVYSLLIIQKTIPAKGSIKSVGYYSYVIYRNGTYTQCRDDMGALKWSSTDSSYVIQSAIDNTNGRIFIRAGSYSGVSVEIPQDKNLVLSGEGWATHLTAPSGANVITIADVAGGFSWNTIITIENMRLSSTTGGGIISDLGTERSPRMNLVNLYIHAKYAIKMVNPYKAFVSRIKIVCTASGGRGMWLVHDRSDFHSGDSYFEMLNLDMDADNCVGILLDATPTQNNGILNLLTFNKFMIYGGGHSSNIGVHMAAGNVDGGSVEYVNIIDPTIEDFGTCFLVEGSSGGAWANGHVMDCTVRGDVYWSGTLGFRFVGQVNNFCVHDVDIHCGTDIKEDERRADSTQLIFNNVKFNSYTLGSGETIFVNCPGYP